MSKKFLIICPCAVGPAWVRSIQGAPFMDPWDHQIGAAQFAIDRSRVGEAGTMLALDMGTGKSLIALMALGIVQPPEVVYYEDPIEPVRVIDLTSGTGKKRVNTLKNSLMYTSPIVVIVNYESAVKGDLGDLVKAVDWDGIILDESHRIKAPNGKQSRSLAQLGAKMTRNKGSKALKLLLTGTPMPHSPLDLYGQFRFIDPEIFGRSFARFRARYAICDRMFPSKVLRHINQDELTDTLDEHSYRVSSEEVLDLPETIHQVLEVRLRPQALKQYKNFESVMAMDLQAGVMTASNALVKLLRLQQFTGGYVSLDGSDRPQLFQGHSPEKTAVLEEAICDLPSCEPIVIFARFSSDLTEIEAMCKRIGRSYSEVSGRRKDLESWQAGNTEVLGVQMQSGGVGIDLTRSAYCFYYSIGFSLGDYEQSLARCHRPGQERCVRYYHLVARDTIDEDVYDALEERSNVVQGVMESLTRRTEGK